MHRILILPDIRLILKPDTRYLITYFTYSQRWAFKTTKSATGIYLAYKVSIPQKTPPCIQCTQCTTILQLNINQMELLIEKRDGN